MYVQVSSLVYATLIYASASNVSMQVRSRDVCASEVNVSSHTSQVNVVCK